jgi:hypothetical protein
MADRSLLYSAFMLVMLGLFAPSCQLNSQRSSDTGITPPASFSESPSPLPSPLKVATDAILAGITAIATSPIEDCPTSSWETTIPSPDDTQKYVGRHFDTLHLPEGLDFREGVFADPYRYVVVDGPSGRIWWADRLMCRDSNGKAYFEVVAALIIPPPQEGFAFADYCTFNSHNVAPIAVGEYDRISPPVSLPLGREPTYGWHLNRITEAWRFDQSTLSYVPLSTAGLDCVTVAP